MATKFQIKRTSVAGRTPNTSNQANSSYIAAGELAVNLTDEKLFSSNGTVAFEVGANLSSISVAGNAALGKIVANGSLGTAGQKLTANSTGGLYWDTAGTGITVELVNSTSNVTTLTTVSTLQFDENSGFNVVNVASGTAKIEINSTFKFWQVDGVQKLTATGLDTVNFIAGNNITITANGANTPQSIAFSTSLTPTFTSATFGNSTVNTTVNSTAIAVTQVVANNTTGTPGQVLTSNGTGVYWSYKPTQDITLNTFTGNGSNTQFKLTTTVEPERTLVFINGIIQRPTTDYTITNGTITFTNSAPLQNDIIQVRIIGFENLGDAEYITDDYLGNGSNTVYTLSTSQSSNNYSFVFLNGVAQVPGTDYSISGSTLTFTVAPPNNEKIRVTSLNFYDDLVTTVYTANGTATVFGLPHNTTSKRVFVSLNGLNQAPVTDFNVSANTLTFTNPPAANDTVIIRSYALADDSAGANTTVQYNKSGVLAGSLGFVFNETTNNVTVGNTLVVPNLIISASNPPANSTAAGTTGTITWDSSYIYVAIGTNTWKKIAISANGAAGGGGGSGLVRDSFTGNGANVNFTLSTAPVNEAQTLVFVDRVLQRDADYSLSGTTLTFASAPDNNAEIDVYIADPAATEVAGANTNIIFNDSDIASGSAAFTFNKTTNTVALSNTLTVGSNLTINTSAIFIGNSTVNTTIIAGNVDLQGTQLRVGNVVVNGNQLTLGNVTITDTQITVGNSTVNTVLGQTGSLSGNGSQLTSVNAIALQGNSVNDILLAANTAANTLASAAFSNAATRADNAYSNATTYASNADNISSGTLNTARLPATVNVSTTINVGANVNINTSTIFIGNSTVNTTIAAGNINLQGTQLTVGNVTVTGDSYTIGNSTVNTSISAGSITINGVNVNTAITSNAATAYSNATSYADTKAGQAFTNAASRADSAYSNAVAYAASNSYVNTTFLPFTGGTLTGNLTVNASANIVSNLSANNVTFRGDVQIDGNLTVSGTSVVINATSLAVEDNMIYLNNGSQVSHPDLGFAGNYNDGSYKHAGFFRDATDGVWKVFDGYTPEPDASAYIDTTNNTFRIAHFTANAITGNSFSGNGASLTSINATNITSGTLDTARLPATANITTAVNVGANVTANTTTLFVGNSTVNTNISAATILINGVNVNTAITSNAATAYSNAIAYSGNAALAYANATTYSSNADNISSGTLNTARLPATVNVSTIVNVGANSFVNTTAHFVGNSTVNTSISAATILINGVNVNTAITSNAATAYSNATTFASNADNISSGTLNTARLPATVNVSTILNVGANSFVNTSAHFVGNSTVNTSISAATILINGVNVNTAITSNAATAYSNAIAYSGNAALAYANATTYASNATNISSGTIGFARLPALYLGTTAIQSTSAAQAVSGITTLAAGNTTITGFANVTSSIQGGGALTIAGALSGVTTAAMGNTTITGFVTASNFADATGTYNVNLGSGGSEGRGLVAGFSGGSYGGIGYNVRHTVTGATWIAPGGDTSSYLLFNGGGFTFYGAGSGSAGRTLSYTTLATLNSSGAFNTAGAITQNSNQVLHAGNYTSYPGSFDGLTSKTSGTGTYTTSGDFRAPIFYDSNDTNYFIDPSSTSRVNVLQFSSGATAGPYFYYGNNQQNLYFRGNASSDVGMSFFDSSGNWRVQIYGSSGNYGFLNGNWSGWDIRKVPSGSLFLNNQSTYYIDGSEIYYNRVYGTTDIRSPIFYDNNNTSYYTDPASTSQINYAVIQNSISGEGYRFTHPQGGYYVTSAGTVTGAFKIKLPTARLHSSTMLQFKVKIYEYATGQTHEFIFSGYNYGGGYWVNISATQLTDYGRGAFAIRYGSDSTGNCIWIGETGTTWSYPQVYVTDVLTGYSGYSNDWGNGWSVTLVTSFNTVDTSRTASLVKTVNNASNWTFADYATIFYDSNNTGYYVDPTGTSRLSTIYCGDVYNDLGGWFRNYGGTGIYNQSYGIHFYADTTSYWNLHSSNGLRIRDGYGGNIKGYLYYDSNGFGLLHSSGGWAVRTTTSVVEAYNSFYAPIMYDSNDSSFYCDPNGSSYLVYTNTRNLAFRGVGGDSGASQDSYGIYQEPGAWSHPYPDLVIGYHTGIKIGGYYGYNGTRFYNNNPASGSLIASIGDGDSALRSYDNIIAYASDGRLKENIQPITNAIEKVKKITGMTFDWKPMVRDLGFEPSNVHEAGVIAQDVEAVLPEAIEVAPFDYDWKQPNKSKSGERYLTVKYEKLVPLLIQAIKEQQEQIEELKNMIKEKL